MDRYAQAENPATASSVDPNANVERKNIATLETELFKEDAVALNRLAMYRKLSELYGVDLAEEYLRQLEEHEIYRHDETAVIGKPYCASVTLYPFLLRGNTSIGGTSDAPKNLASFTGAFVNLVFALASQFCGAVSTPEWLSYMDYFIRKEYGDDYYLHADKTIDLSNRGRSIDKVITDAFEQVVYSLNQPAAARGNQSVFWNIAYFDRPYFEGMFENFVFPDGTSMQWASVNWLQKRFMRWFNEERRRKLLTFPVETVNLLDDGNDYVDPEWKDFVAEMWSKGHSFFVYRSDSVDSLSSCCRLRNELQDNTFSYTLGAGGVSTGSKCVISININRLVQDAVWDTPLRDVMDRMEIQIEKIHKYLIAFNEILKERLAAGLLPVYDAGYIALDKQYLTIGVNGLVEGAEALNIPIEADNPEYIAYVDAVLSPIYAANRAARTSELMFNTEMVPAEGLGVKNAAWDKTSKLYVPRDCYNSYFFVVEDPTVNVLDKLRFHGKAFTRYLDGGSACHINLDEHLSKEQDLLLLNAAIRTGCNYLTFNVPNTLCNACGYISKHRLDICPKCGSRDLDYATRIIGYLKLISRFAHDRQIEANKRHYSHGLEEPHESETES
ncbi:anaerobic ribonucleoside-triphosphate reductase [Butyricicoccus sp.]|uniref:anaerobic ribonucleoside-triphosphate reductase n=1 Tax=Butyricicoccus sp. TaxID=2049021 RepID=UPI003AAC2FA8